MANTPYNATMSRAHWAGSNADLDIHLEAYEGDIEGSFRVESLFRSSGLTNFKTVAGRSNTWRGDRVGGATVKGRKAGEALDPTRIVNDKLLITVDTTSYIRTPIDYQDDWTAPDFQAEYSAEHGSAHAKAFDQAHLIQLIKAGSWVAPDSLKASGAFFDGINVTMTGYAAQTDAELKADLIVKHHKDALATFVKRDLGGSLAEFVTLIEPDTFNVLLDHKKLMNVDFQGGNGDNNFAARRVGWLNGIRVIETPRFPTSAIAAHFLGPAFNVTAAEAKARVVIFHPRKTLVTVEAQGMVARVWDDKENFANVLDSYTMYTVGLKRGDCVAVLSTD
ncbi:capsid protein [Sphaerotilus phage vB_SnaP-R1]|uniref:Capsid protein n=1 Tax=Sphaerotilus phage vB_SnaP-R1 TaxID=2696336 RepID=A0A6B9SVI7_9CAUD|nr:capsid protein [Sphaerotilus phage vB_SnaP-R1]